MKFDLDEPALQETYSKGGVLTGIEEAMEMKPEEYWTYFEAFIFMADKESSQKNPFALKTGEQGDSA